MNDNNERWALAMVTVLLPLREVYCWAGTLYLHEAGSRERVHIIHGEKTMKYTEVLY